MFCKVVQRKCLNLVMIGSTDYVGMPTKLSFLDYNSLEFILCTFRNSVCFAAGDQRFQVLGTNKLQIAANADPFTRLTCLFGPSGKLFLQFTNVCTDFNRGFSVRAEFGWGFSVRAEFGFSVRAELATRSP